MTTGKQQQHSNSNVNLSHGLSSPHRNWDSLHRNKRNSSQSKGNSNNVTHLAAKSPIFLPLENSLFPLCPLYLDCKLQGGQNLCFLIIISAGICSVADRRIHTVSVWWIYDWWTLWANVWEHNCQSSKFYNFWSFISILGTLNSSYKDPWSLFLKWSHHCSIPFYLLG